MYRVGGERCDRVKLHNSKFAKLKILDVIRLAVISCGQAYLEYVGNIP